MTDAALLERLLEDGRTLVAPDDAEQEAAAALVEAGLLVCREGEVFRCFDPAEDVCQDHPTRACSAWVWADGGGDAVCRACGTEHEQPAAARRLRSAVQVSRDAAGLDRWLEASVRAVDADARRLRAGAAWSLAVDDADVEVVWLDADTPEALTSRAYATSRAVLYVVACPRVWAGRFGQEPWLTPLSLATWFVEGPAAVREALAGRTAAPAAELPWASSRRVTPRVLPLPLGARLLEVDAERAQLDGHEVVGRDGVAVLALLRVFVSRWREDLADGKAPDDFCVWSVDELRSALVQAEGRRPDPATVRRQLQRLRRGMRDRYQQATGVALGEDDVIERLPGEGYRLHPTRVLAHLR